MKKLTYILAALIVPVLVAPAGVSAQLTQDADVFGGGNLGAIEELVNGLVNIVNLIIPLLIAVAVVVFFYGLIRYILAKGPDAKENARGTLIYGLLAIFVMVTLWGIIFFFANILGLGFGSPAEFSGPQVAPVPIE